MDGAADAGPKGKTALHRGGGLTLAQETSGRSWEAEPLYAADPVTKHVELEAMRAGLEVMAEMINIIQNRGGVSDQTSWS